MKPPYKISFFLFFMLYLTSCNPDDDHGNSGSDVDDPKFEQYGLPFAGVPEISDINMYEVNPLVFSQQRNLAGVRQRLDQIQDLGINVIWLMPIHPIGQEKAFGSPYAVRDFQARLKEVFREQRQASDLFTSNEADYRNIPNGADILRFTTNHDDNAWEDTPQNVFNTIEGSLAAFLITSYFGGVPMVYNGQEIGVSDRIPFFFGTNYRINWTQNPHILEEYKRILKFRVESNAVRNGVLENLGSTAAILSFKKTFQNEEVIVLVNTLGNNSQIQIPDSLKGRKWLNVLLDTEVVLENELALSAYSYLILKGI